MSRVKFCLISPYESEQIRQGVDISCKDHRHISRNDVLILTGGTKLRPWLAEDENYFAVADWAMMPDGSESRKHVVLRQAREWRNKNSCMQWVPIGGKGRTNGNRYKIHCRQSRAPKCKTLQPNLSEI